MIQEDSYIMREEREGGERSPMSAPLVLPLLFGELELWNGNWSSQISGTVVVMIDLK